MSSVQEDNRSSQVDGSEKADGAFVVAGGKSAVLLEFGEEVFNQMARFIEVFVIRARLEPIGFWGMTTVTAACSKRAMTRAWAS